MSIDFGADLYEEPIVAKTFLSEDANEGSLRPHTLAATIGEESVTLEDVYEPYLMQLGFLTRTPRGRCVTQKAYEHLHVAFVGQQRLDL